MGPGMASLFASETFGFFDPGGAGNSDASVPLPVAKHHLHKDSMALTHDPAGDLPPSHMA